MFFSIRLLYIYTSIMEAFFFLSSSYLVGLLSTSRRGVLGLRTDRENKMNTFP